MGFSDRDYAKADYAQKRGGGGGGFGGPPMMQQIGGWRSWSMTKWLIVINIVIFILDLITGAALRPDGSRYPALFYSYIHIYGYFSMDLAITQYQAWRFLTFQFLHGSVFHLLFNMMGIYYFGRFIEQYLGSARFLAFYFLCGFAGPLAYIALMYSGVLEFHPTVPMVGASAGVFGLLIAVAKIAPNMRVQLLFPPMPVTMRQLALGVLLIAAATVISRGPNDGGEAAHLGGALLGFLLLTPPGIGIINFLVKLWPFKRKPATISGTSASSNAGAWLQQIENKQKLIEEVDRILLKIEHTGIQSLTEKEKHTLAEATRQQRGQ